MLVCPHCSQEIELKAPEKVWVSWWNKPIGGPSVSLGCGTLIIIAIIVGVFSGTNDISGDVFRLSQKVDALTVLVEEIHTSMSDTP